MALVLPLELTWALLRSRVQHTQAKSLFEEMHEGDMSFIHPKGKSLDKLMKRVPTHVLRDKCQYILSDQLHG